MAADTDRPANVQAYLDKHRISSLFETLTSQLVKDLPADPLGFLILKLQGIKKKAPASSTSTKPAASSGLRKPTATSSSGARKPVSSSASSVASSRSTISSRPATSSSTGIAKPSSAKTRPSSVKPSSTAPPDTKAPSSRAPGGGSRIPRSPVKPIKSGTTGKPSAPSTTAPPTGAAKTKKPVSATTRATTSSTKGKPDHDSKLTKPSSAATSSKPSSVPTSSSKERVTKTTPSLPTPVAPAPPSSAVSSCVSDDELSEDTQQQLDYDTDDEHDQYDQMEQDQFDINALVLKLKRSKGPSKRHRDHLSVASSLLQTSPSSGYQTSEDESSEDEEEEGGLDVAESATVLELEEGITLGHQTRIIAKKLPRPDPVINLNVMVCGRCGNIMNQQDSASQVDGSHVTFPQWDDTTSTLTSKPCDESSTSTSWHGVGQVPLVSCMEATTDETSDLMLPDTVPAAQQPRHDEDQEQLEEEGMMIGGEDQL